MLVLNKLICNKQKKRKLQISIMALHSAIIPIWIVLYILHDCDTSKVKLRTLRQYEVKQWGDDDIESVIAILKLFGAAHRKYALKHLLQNTCMTSKNIDRILNIFNYKWNKWDALKYILEYIPPLSISDEEKNKIYLLFHSFNHGDILSSSNTSETPEIDTKEDNMCVICFERPRQSAIPLCGHRSSCQECSAKLIACPICRAPIERWIPIYNS